MYKNKTTGQTALGLKHNQFLPIIPSRFLLLLLLLLLLLSQPEIPAPTDRKKYQKEPDSLTQPQQKYQRGEIIYS